MDDYTGAWGLSASDVYVVGDHEGINICHYNGAQWTAIWNDIASLIAGRVWGTSDSDIYISGSTGNPDGTDEVLHYDGASWAVPLSAGVNVGLDSVLHGLGPNDVYAVGGSGAILHYGPLQ